MPFPREFPACQPHRLYLSSLTFFCHGAIPFYIRARSALVKKCLFFGSNPLVAQKAYHAEYSMPSGCDLRAFPPSLRFLTSLANVNGASQRDLSLEFIGARHMSVCLAMPDPIP